LQLRGGRQPDLAITISTGAEIITLETRQREYRPPRLHEATVEEIEAHEIFLATIKDALWKRA
ncbi:MAG: DNA polymerase III subunit epsilon, partial [Pseudomonadota bacterium]|nr:DNA polymerase III subunit epsilon [Pseudomonadota bacterium]